jgi:hypothetical protein
VSHGKQTINKMKKKLLALLTISLIHTGIIAQNLTIPTDQWPVIHQNNYGTKESPYPGPVSLNIQTEESLNNKPVLMLQGNDYLYYQVSQLPYLYAFDPEDITSGPVHQVYTGAWFPNMGGGMIDNLDNNWWNISGRLIRYNSTFTVVDSSQNYATNNGDPVPPVNGVSLLNGNRILASSVLNHAWILSTELDSLSNVFPILDTINFQNFIFNGDSIWLNTIQFNPRPILDDSGFVYLTGGDWLAKISFDTTTNKFNREIEWAFENPTAAVSEFTLSNPVIINNHICVSTTAQANSYEELYVLNLNTGMLEYSFTPFPNALGVDALHTLGGIQSSNSLFALGNSPDGNAGVASYNLSTGLELWPFVSLKNISEAFCISSANDKLYLSYSEDALSPFKIASIDLNSGISTDIYIDSTITALPTGHLGLIGSAGLIYPTPNGIIRLWNNSSNGIPPVSSQLNKPKLLKIIDLLGREVTPLKNTLQIYIYEDGSIEKKIILQ